MNTPRVAILHDWLLGMRGGEKVLGEVLKIYPEADIYTIFYDPKNIIEAINQRNPVVSFFNRIPFVHKFYRYLLPFYPLAIKNLRNKLRHNHLDSTYPEGKYQLVISISHCAVKNIDLANDSKLSSIPHLCYCLTPMRYIWDQYDRYFKGKKIEYLVKPFLKGLRKWDTQSSKSIKKFIAISSFIKRRIEKNYPLSSDVEVIYPPVDNSWIEQQITVHNPQRTVNGKEQSSIEEFKNFFLCVCALVPYKNIDYLIDAFNELQLPLLIIGKGPEEKKLKARVLNPHLIRFASGLSQAQLGQVYCNSRALVFAAEEDFGIAPVEAQAAGKAVICFGRGGVLETVDFSQISKTGISFNELSSKSIVKAVREFLEFENTFLPENCKRQAEKFSSMAFRRNFENSLKNFTELYISKEQAPNKDMYSQADSKAEPDVVPERIYRR